MATTGTAGEVRLSIARDAAEGASSSESDGEVSGIDSVCDPLQNAGDCSDGEVAGSGCRAPSPETEEVALGEFGSPRPEATQRGAAAPLRDAAAAPQDAAAPPQDAAAGVSSALTEAVAGARTERRRAASGTRRKRRRSARRSPQGRPSDGRPSRERSRRAEGETPGTSPRRKPRVSPARSDEVKDSLPPSRSAGHHVSRSVSPAMPIREPAYDRSDAGIHEREVYVGDLPAQVSLATVRAAFEDLFKQLPQYKDRYHLGSPVVTVRVPSVQGLRASRFLFVEFADATLASTAILMSGLWIAGRSVRVCRPSCGPARNQGVEGLDVEPLRASGHIPWEGGEGATMLSEVWVGGFPKHSYQSSALCTEISRALLALPMVQARFPDLKEAATGLQFGGEGAFAFVELANEVLASTAVAIGTLELANGQCIRTGWPAGQHNAAARAPPSLAVPKAAPLKDNSAGYSVEDTECEIFIGGIGGCDAETIWSALTDLFQSLPAYRAAYQADGPGPVVNLRTGKVPFAFACLADRVLASTAVALGSLQLGDRSAHICRASHYREPEGGPAPPLELVLPRAACKRRLEAPAPGRSGAHAPPLPPSTAMLWVGNLTPIKPQEEARRHLDSHLTGLALSSPGYELELGPPVKRVSVHQSGRFAFVELRDAAVAEQLIPVFDGSDYMGRPLAANWATHGRGRQSAGGPSRRAASLSGPSWQAGAAPAE